jgi:hypothetical protein
MLANGTADVGVEGKNRKVEAQHAPSLGVTRTHAIDRMFLEGLSGR